MMKKKPQPKQKSMKKHEDAAMDKMLIKSMVKKKDLKKGK